MSKLKQIEAQLRDRVGKGAARAARLEKRVPAVIYGAGEPPLAISLDFNKTTKLIYAGHFLTTLFDISVGGKVIRAIPKDYQLDKIKDFPMHVDFLRLGENAKVRVEIPVHVINQDLSPGIKRGGSLNIVQHRVLLQVPAEEIPEAITIDLKGMEFNTAVHISSIKLPEGTKVITHEKDLTLVTISAPAGGEAAAAAPAAAPAGKKK